MPDSTGALINQLMNPPDPFARLGSMAQGMSAARQFQADQAAAEAYRQSIDPETGQFDQAKFNAIASQAPGGSYNFGRQMQSAGTGLQAQSAGTSASLDAQAAKLNGIAGQLYPLMQKVLNGESVTGTELQKTVDQAGALGLTTPDMVKNMQKQIDRIGPDGNANDVVRGAMYGTLTGAERLRAVTGQPVGVMQGPTTTFVQPIPGAAQSPAGQVPMGLTPEARAKIQLDLQSPHPFTDDQGVAHPNASLGDWMKYRGINPYSVVQEPAAPLPSRVGGPVPGAGAMPGGPGGPASTVTTGRAPVPPGSAPGAGPRSAVQPPQATPPVAPPAGMAPDTLEAGRKAYVVDQETQGTLPSRLGPLQSALSVLRTHPGMQTVGQDELYQLTQLAHAFGLPAGRINNANAYAELSKYLAQNSQSVPGANRSDMAQNAAAAGTPHIGQGREAMTQLLAKSVGVERLRVAGVDYFNAQHPDPQAAAQNSGLYQSKTRSWLSKQDPVAYAMDQMTAKEITDYYTGLSGADKKRFAASVADAKKLYPYLQKQPEPPRAATTGGPGVPATAPLPPP